MSEVKFLRNSATGCVFMYSAELFKKPGMIACDIKGNITPEVTQIAAKQVKDEAAEIKAAKDAKKGIPAKKVE